jgi:hypothetical protein
MNRGGKQHQVDGSTLLLPQSDACRCAPSEPRGGYVTEPQATDIDAKSLKEPWPLVVRILHILLYGHVREEFPTSTAQRTLGAVLTFVWGAPIILGCWWAWREIARGADDAVPPEIVEPSHIAYYKMSQYVSAFWNLATVVDIFVNLWFSFHFFKQHRIEQTIVWATSHSHQLTEQKVVGRLGWAAIGAWSVFFATASFLAYGCSQTDEGMQLVVCLASDAWAFALIWSQLMHLCFLWLWVNWAAHCRSKVRFSHSTAM